MAIREMMVRKNFLFIIVFLGSIILFTSCNRKVKKDHWTDTLTSGTVPISCDGCFEPLISSEIEVFETRYKDAHIKPIYTDEVRAIRLLLQDSVRLAVVSRELTAKENSDFLKIQMVAHSYKIALDAIALIVNKNNPDSVIGVPTLKKILTGKITRWNQVYPGSKLGKIDVMFDNPNSSTVHFAIDSICRGEKLSEKLYAQKNNLDVIKMVEKYPNSLGIIGVNWVTNEKDSTNMSFSRRVRVMEVSRFEDATPDNSCKPYQAYIALNQYPLIRNVYIVLSDPKQGLSTGFTHFVAGQIGQKIVLKSGILPATQNIEIRDVSVDSK